MRASGERPVYAFAGFRLDAQHRRLSRADGEPIPLAPKVFDTLLYFVERPGELLEKHALLGTIWPNVVVEENNLNQAISTLRRVLGELPGDHRFIVTEPGRGYRFVAAVRSLPGESEGPDDGAAAATETGVSARVGPRKRGKLDSLAAALGLLVVAGLVGAVAYVQRHTDSVLPNSVAVLPLEDLSPDSENAYIAAGMHVEIIDNLTKLHDLNVITRDAVLQYSENRPAHSEIASKLNVQSILAGTFQYVDDEIRVNVQLVDPKTGVNLWADTYRSDFDNVFAIQADIAANVANALSAELSSAERQRLERRPTASMEAYRKYWQSFIESENRVESLRLLEEATALDPEFALAYAQLALLYGRSLIDWINDPAVPIEPSELERRVIENAEKALRLDPDLALPYVGLGELYAYSWRWGDAESAFASAFARRTNDPLVLGFYSQFETFRGDYSAAIPMAERVLELDPPSPSLAAGTGSLYFVWLAHGYAGNVDAALDALRDHLKLHPNQIPARLNLAFLEARRGNREQAANALGRVEELIAQRGGPSPGALANLAYGYSRIGYAEDAKRLFEEVERVADDRFVHAGTRAVAYLAMGDDERALRWLDEALEGIRRHEPAAGWFNLMLMKHNVTGDPVLEEPRYEERRERIRGI
jgi:TolB-like protein/DNA-binding winged helix-turn-helix (wHTH) protein/Flp pilus assembly protein TadD